EGGIATLTKRPSRRHGDACPDRIMNWILRGQRLRYEAAIEAGDAEAARAHKSLQGAHDRLVQIHGDVLGKLAAVERRYEALVEAIAAGVDVHTLWRETEDDPVAKWLGRDTVFRDRVYAAV